LSLDDAVNAREFDRLLNEEHGVVVPYNIPISLFGIETRCKTSHVTTKCIQYVKSTSFHMPTYRTVSAEPLEPPTVENRTNVGTSTPTSFRTSAWVTSGTAVCSLNTP
jgi:hypothetical protein